MNKLFIQPIIDKKDQITDEKSSYNPSKAVKDRMTQLRNHFYVAQKNMDKPYEEFNVQGEELDLVTYQTKMRQRYNISPPAMSNDPDDAWKANTADPLAHDKVFAMVAHLTSSILTPTIIAQNNDDVLDKDAAIVMQDCVEWALERAKYEKMMMMGVQELCINPGITIYLDYAEVYTKIKDIKENGEFKMKEIVNELYSGFFANIVPNEELYIANVYEPDIQKQPFLIRRKVIDFEAAQQKYGHIKEFKNYVKPGLRIFYSEDEDCFFEQYDDSQTDRLVEEVTYYNYSSDLELRLINGVLIDDPDRPLQRKMKEVGLPYPFVHGGYERFNSRFFYFMPLMHKLIKEQDVVDVLTNMIIDGTYLQLMPPVGVYGSEEVDSSIIQPGKVTSFVSNESQVVPLNVGNNLNAGLSILQNRKNVAGEASQSQLSSGMSLPGDQTKYEVQQLQSNAVKVLGLTGKYLGFLVKDIGDIMVQLVLQYIPIAQGAEITDSGTVLKFPTILLHDRKIEGKRQTRKTVFTQDLPTSEEEEKKKSYELLGKQIEQGMVINEVNPDLFKQLKYFTKVEPKFIDENTKFQKSVFLYDRLLQNPLANQEENLRNFVSKVEPGEEDRFIKKEQPAMPGMEGMQMPENGGNKSTMTKELTAM